MPRVVIDPAVPESLDNEIARLRGLDVGELRARWHTVFRRRAPPHLPRHLLFRILAYRLQADRLGELDNDSRRVLDRIGSGANCGLFVRDRETLVRIGLRGGAGRIRTSNQTIISGR